jgi:hypothetical protein
MANYILCPECFAKTDGVEKCCTHGCFDAVCAECGKIRKPDDPHWHCRGSVAVPSPGPGQEAK